MTTSQVSSVLIRYKGKDTPVFQDVNSTLVHNVNALFNRQKGTLFRVSEEGKLEKVSGFCSRVKYWWRGESKETQKVVTQALSAFNASFDGVTDTELSSFIINTYFSSKGAIGRLSHKIYDRTPHTVKMQIGQGDLFCNFKVERQLPDLEIDFGNDVDNHNFWKLLQRQKGEIYQVNGEKKLKKAERRLNADQQRAVKAVVTQAIKQLNAQLGKIQTNQVHKVVLKQIFQKQGPLARMSRRVYERGAIAEGSNIEELLGSNLPQCRAELVKAFKGKNRTAIESAFIDLTVEEFTFVQSLGLDLERNRDGGSGGARYARDRFGRKILVVKPGDEGPHGVNNPQWYARLKRLFVSPRRCLRDVSEPLSEVDSWAFDRRFDVRMVPPTTLRYVKSRQFKGKDVKECSLQMFVNECKTLGDYLDTPSWRTHLPRSLQRSNLKGRKEELVGKLPQALIEKLAVHNGLIEDIDCHFENVLAKDVAPLDATHFLSRFEKGDVQDADVQKFVESFFEKKHNQDLLDQLLTSEQGVMLVKHDGGSSNPRYHPTGYLSQRFKHLFEVLPHFDQPFSDASKKMLGDKHVLQHVLEEKGRRSLRNIVTQNVFDKFWKTHEDLFKKWMNTEGDEEYALRLELINQLLLAVNDRENHDKYNVYFSYHLIRIYDTLQTRRESFEVLKKYVDRTGDEIPMRDFFQNVHSQKDFQRELNELSRGE